MGVKDVFYNVAPRAIYDEKMYHALLKKGPLKHIRPEAARKLVEGAVEYAQRFDLAPHPDYRVARLIFGDIAASACAEEFVYGKDGKPFFFAGPHDDLARCDFILRALERTCGPRGYDYVLPVKHPNEPKEYEYDLPY